MIIALQGPRAVGKSTLTENIRNGNRNIVVHEGFKYTGRLFNLDDENEFYENQRIYIRQKIQQYQQLDAAKDNLIVRGAEDIYFYTCQYPKNRGFSWKVKENIGEELKKLGRYRSDLILYLDATEKMLQIRNTKDTRNRKNLDEWMKDWYMNMRRYFSELGQTRMINTELMNKEEVYQSVISVIANEEKL